MNGKRILAGILLAAMLASLMPTAAFAEDTAAVAENAAESVSAVETSADGAMTASFPTGAVEDAAASDIIGVPEIEDVPVAVPVGEDSETEEVLRETSPALRAPSPKGRAEEILPIETAAAEEVTAELQASYSGTCGDNLTWELDTDTGVLTISGTGKMTDWSSYSRVPWYSYRSSIQTVTIGSGVTSIGSKAFYWCTSLTSVTIPDSVTSIGDWAFNDCNSLTSVTIPDSVTSIGNNAFCDCDSLTSATIGNGVTSIGSYAFYGCGLTRVKIGNSVTSIGEYAFYSCTGLTSVTISDSVTSIGEYAFYNCRSLTSVTIGSGVTTIGRNAFGDCKSLTSVTIPDSVTSIGENAFSGCTGLTSVTIGNGVTSIGNDAFSYCSSLTNVTIGSGVTCIEDGMFSCCYNLKTVAFGNSVVRIGGGAFYGCGNLRKVIYCGTSEQWDGIDIRSSRVDAGGSNITVGNTTLDAGSLAGSNTELKLAERQYHAWELAAPAEGAAAGTARYVCSYCSATRTESVPVVDPDAPLLQVHRVKGRAGETVTVKLTIENNPGLAGLLLTLRYDPALTLTKIAAGDALGSLTFTEPGDLTAKPLRMLWDGQDADATSGTLTYLTFAVKPNTPNGEYYVSLSFDPDDAYGDDFANRSLTIMNGAVTVCNTIPGDVNEDNATNAKDVTFLRRFLAGGYGITVDADVADVNKDGAVNAKDVTILRRAVVGGYGVTLS